MRAEIADVVLQQDETWPPARKIKAAQDLYFVSFNVDRQEIDWLRRSRLHKDIVEGPNPDFDDRFRLRPRRHAIAVERR